MDSLSLDALNELARVENQPHKVYYRPTRRHAWREAGQTLTRTAAREWAESLSQEGRFGEVIYLPSDTWINLRVAK